MSTCGVTANNTVLYIGTGCPTWYLPFACVAGNDNASPSCASNALASRVAITATQSSYFLQLGGVNGEGVISGLKWVYVPPTASATASRTPSRSPSRQVSRSKTGSVSGTRSRTRKGK